VKQRFVLVTTTKLTRKDQPQSFQIYDLLFAATRVGNFRAGDRDEAECALSVLNRRHTSQSRLTTHVVTTSEVSPDGGRPHPGHDARSERNSG
jgi:hypothetical protein